MLGDNRLLHVRLYYDNKNVKQTQTRLYSHIEQRNK